ncbi:MAG TPA: YbhN family protein [Hansschlegelia sp.]
MRAAIGTAATVFGAILLWRALSRYSDAQLTAAIEAVPVARLAGAGAFSAASYLCHTGYDALALRYAGAPQRWRRAALASFCSTSISHTLNLAGFGSAILRWRFYARWGLTAEQIVTALAFLSVTVVLGHIALAGFACLLAPDVASLASGLSAGGVRALGLGCLAVIGVYLCAAAISRTPFTVRGRVLRMPSLRLAIAQVAVGAVDYACVAASLHQVIAAVSEASYPTVAAAYAAANAASAVTRAPGGLGVLETVVQRLLPAQDLIGPLLVYRAVHFLAPLVLGLSAFALSEIVAKRRALKVE